MAKTITLIILRSDRELWDGGPVELKVTDLSRGIKVLHDNLSRAVGNRLA